MLDSRVSGVFVYSEMQYTFNRGHCSRGTTVGRHPAAAERTDRFRSQEAYSLLKGQISTTIVKARQNHHCIRLDRHNEVSADGEVTSHLANLKTAIEKVKYMINTQSEPIITHQLCAK